MPRPAHGLLALALALLLSASIPAATATLYTDTDSTATGKRAPGPPPPPLPPNGTAFAGVFTSSGVLQKGAAGAAVFGTVRGGATGATAVTVSVSVTGGAQYSVPAATVSFDAATNVLVWKAVLKPHPTQGDDVSVSAACSGCANTTAATLAHLTYGDVWFCSGQSNMELPMGHALTRNRTYQAVDTLGMYQNVRLFRRAEHVAAADGAEVWVLPPTLPGWQRPNSTNLAPFSALCWFFAQELTDMAAAEGRPAPVLGLIQSAWGGTQIEPWTRNDSAIKCLNATGGAETFAGQGKIFNGMAAPFVNYTLFGFLWYQGENNVHECAVPAKGAPSSGGTSTCGNVLSGTGYACKMRAMVDSWRALFGGPGSTQPFGIVSLAAGTSEGHERNMANFRLAQTASYGFLPGPPGSGMTKTFVAQGYDAGDPGFRGGGAAGPRAEADSPFQGAYDAPFPGRAGYAAQGLQEFTPQYMGGLHPRAKQTVARRLALAARAVAYGEAAVPFTGPVLKNCSVAMENTLCVPGEPACRRHSGGINQRQITLNFDEALLGADAVRVWPTPPYVGRIVHSMYDCLNGTCLEACAGNVSCAEACAVLPSAPCRSGLPVTPVGPNGNGNNPVQYDASLYSFYTQKSVTPLEVQLNHSIWMPALISFNALSAQGDPLQRRCKPGQCTNYTRVNGWSSVLAAAPVSIPIGCGAGLGGGGWQQCPPPERLRPGEVCYNCTHHFVLTGVRYAWSDSPCCGGFGGTEARVCPVNNCPISTWNSTLPAVPFSADIVWNNETSSGVGACRCTAPHVCG